LGYVEQKLTSQGGLDRTLAVNEQGESSDFLQAKVPVEGGAGDAEGEGCGTTCPVPRYQHGGAERLEGEQQLLGVAPA
jgi:hypothetical protein